MTRWAAVLALSALSGCEGEIVGAVEPWQPLEPTAGEPPVQVGTFQGRSEGLPPVRLGGTAQFDGTLYAVASDGLYRLLAGSGRWEPVALGVKATSVTRIDNVVWVTWADGLRGGLYRLAAGDDGFAAVAGLSQPAHAVLKRGSELWVATGSGLQVSSDRGATFGERFSGTPFDRPAAALVASSAATRVFALVGGRLWHSDDEGKHWGTGLFGEEVKAVGADAQFALVQTATRTLRSDNYGNTFHGIELGATARSFAASGQRAFAGTPRGMRVSDDGGRTWRDASAGLPEGTGVMQLFLAGGALVASTGEAVYVAQVQ